MAIYHAENKEKEFYKQSGVILGGIGGGAMTGAASGLVCGPGAVVCEFFTVIGGSIIGGWVAYKLLEANDDLVTEVSSWDLF